MDPGLAARGHLARRSCFELGRCGRRADQLDAGLGPLCGVGKQEAQVRRLVETRARPMSPVVVSPHSNCSDRLSLDLLARLSLCLVEFMRRVFWMVASGTVDRSDHSLAWRNQDWQNPLERGMLSSGQEPHLPPKERPLACPAPNWKNFPCFRSARFRCRTCPCTVPQGFSTSLADM